MHCFMYERLKMIITNVSDILVQVLLKLSFLVLFNFSFHIDDKFGCLEKNLLNQLGLS